MQPGKLRTATGIRYQQFMNIESVQLQSSKLNTSQEELYGSVWMELLTAEKATVLAKYDHPHWGKYAAITRNAYGKGEVTYLGTYPSEKLYTEIILQTINRSGVSLSEFDSKFPLIVRSGTNRAGKKITYLMNYSGQSVEVENANTKGKELISDRVIAPKEKLTIKPWDLMILESK